MGIFSGIKNRVLHRREEGADYQDIKSTVLSEPPRPEGYEPYEQQPVPEPPEPQFLRPERFQREPEYDDRFRSPAQKRYEELTVEQPSGQPAQEARYDIIDKLNIIEAQLSAIRSQTETINERLKNLELRLPRRY